METKTKEQVKLVSMREFVLEQEQEIPKDPQFNDKSVTSWDRCFVQRVILYAKFLSTPLQLGHFIPCSLDGVVLKDFGDEYPTFQEADDLIKAKSRVLFEGFETDGEYLKSPDNGCFYWRRYSDIEDLTKYNLTLTQTAKEMFNLK